jgi:hypothetical protein
MPKTGFRKIAAQAQLMRGRKTPADVFAGFIILAADAGSMRGRKRLLQAVRAAVACFFITTAVLAISGLAARATSVARDGAASDAVPKIASVQPAEAQPGSRITVKIEGENFLSGAYVTFSDPAIRVIATRRISETELDADIAVGELAQPKTAQIYVSNPSGASAHGAFTIGSATNNNQQANRRSQANSPVVTKVDPAGVRTGGKESLKVTGRNFKEGAKVAFSNPGIRVLGTDYRKSTELLAQIEVAPNAPTGKTSLFVINPDDSEVETSFEVNAANQAKSSDSKSQAGMPPQQFSVYNLGDATSIFQNPDKAKGQLILEGGQLRYEQDGKVVFTAKPVDIQEIAPNVFFGLSTGTFHIILNSGKTYNFVSSTLAPADTNAIIESLRSALK